MDHGNENKSIVRAFDRFYLSCAVFLSTRSISVNMKSKNATQTRITDFQIDWKNLILSARAITDPSEFKYLSEISKYCNNGGIPGGIYAKVFDYQEDSEFVRLLSKVQSSSLLQKKFVEVLFCNTAIIDHLHGFYEDPAKFPTEIEYAYFEFLEPSKIEDLLKNHLYNYGMYRHFFDNNSPDDAARIAQKFTWPLYNAEPDNIVFFCTRLPWGLWFDPHSCSDCTFLFINKKDRKIWLFCFSHSD
jgi:hypothetical protein